MAYLGDQNTSCFHKSVNGRQNKNKLLLVTMLDREVVEGHGAVKSEVIVYYHNVLGEKQRAGIMNEEVIKSAVKLKLTFVQQHLITQDVTRKEIKDVYVQFEKQKSPWSGWFQRKFLQKNVAYSWGRCNQCY